MKYNKGFILIGIMSILGTGYFLRQVFDSSIEQIPVNWSFTGEAHYYTTNTPSLAIMFLIIQVLFLWAALCEQESLMIPLKITLVSQAKSVQLSSKQWQLLQRITLPLGIICLLNFTYLGFATFKNF